jgi:hypothetical protein
MDSVPAGLDRHNMDDSRLNWVILHRPLVEAEQDGLILGQVGIDLDCCPSATYVQESGRNALDAPIRYHRQASPALQWLVARIPASVAILPVSDRQVELPLHLHDHLPRARLGVRRVPLRLSGTAEFVV